MFTSFISIQSVTIRYLTGTVAGTLGIPCVNHHRTEYTDGEVCMTICMTESEIRFEGNWTLTEVTRNIDSLSQSLQQLKPYGENKLRIDCCQMKDADMSGLQLLSVWMQCARFRGADPTLVNVPEKLRYAMQALMGDCFADICAE